MTKLEEICALMNITNYALTQVGEGKDLKSLTSALRELTNLQAELEHEIMRSSHLSSNTVHSYDILIDNVRQWGFDKGIIQKGDAAAQMLKCVAEVGELADGVATSNMDEIVDGVGDVLVTLILLCQIKQIDMFGCLQVAYDEIKGRKGQMVGGVFVKEDQGGNDAMRQLLSETPLSQ